MAKTVGCGGGGRMAGGHACAHTPPVTPATTTHTPTSPAEFQAPDKKAPRYDKCLRGGGTIGVGD